MRAKNLVALVLLAASLAAFAAWVAAPRGTGEAPVASSTGSTSPAPDAPGQAEGMPEAPAPSEPSPERKEILPGRFAREIVATGRLVAGRVVDETSKPAVGATVLVRTESLVPGPEAKVDNQTVRSAADGSFLVSGLGDGPFTVEAFGLGRGVAEEHDVPPDTRGIELRLPGPTGFAGVVLDEATGKPVPRCRVVTTMKPMEMGKVPRPGGYGTSNDEGRFELADLRAGVHDATFRAQGYLEARLEGIEVRTGEILRGLEVRMRPTATIRGTVVDAETGRPVAGARVTPFGTGQLHRLYFGSSVSSTDGAFEVADIVPGKHRLEASHPDYPGAKGEEFEVSSGEVLEGVVLRLARGGGLEGIVPGEGGRPWTGARIFVFPAIGQAQVPRYLAVADSDGYFSVGGVAPGRYRVKALPPLSPEDTGQSCEARAQVAFETVHAGHTTRVEFPGPTPGCTLAGRVLGGERGVPRMDVVLWPASSRLAREEFPWRAETGEGGAFEIRNAPPGEATVSVSG
ncbi:MAG: carboxypeptidase regulatory-like domain-containing protein, partial [Planctomycetota bacterium]